MTAFGSQAQIRQALWIYPHDSAAGCVHSHEVATHHQNAARLGRTLDRSVAFHPDNAVHDGEAAGENAVQFGDGTINTDLVKLIFGPAVDRTRYYAKKVFHGEGCASPMVRFHLS